MLGDAARELLPVSRHHPRVFSSSCVGSPLEYWVQGPVLRSNNTLSIRMEGQREKHQNCYGTGQWTNDVLVFTYAYQC